MNLQYKITVSIAIVLFTTGFITGKKFTKPETVIKTEVVEKVVDHNNVVVQTKEVIRPDGTKEILTTSTDTSTHTKDLKAETTVKVNKKYILGLDYTVLGTPSYDVLVGYKLFDSFFLTSSYSMNYDLNDKKLKLGILVEF